MYVKVRFVGETRGGHYWGRLENGKAARARASGNNRIDAGVWYWCTVTEENESFADVTPLAPVARIQVVVATICPICQKGRVCAYAREQSTPFEGNVKRVEHQPCNACASSAPKYQHKGVIQT